MLGKRLSNKVSYVFPQGWAFFTKKPKSEYNYLIYEINKDSLKNINFKNQSSENNFGFSRHARKLFSEVSFLAAQIEDNKWESSSMDNLVTLDSNKLNDENICVELKVKEELKYFNKNKKYYIIKYNTVPFSWAKMNQEKFNPVKFIVLNIKNDN